MSTTVKHGDTIPLTLTIGVDITGATVRVLCRRGSAAATVLPSTVTDYATGAIVHELDGTLAIGNYDLEVEITRNGVVQTAPTVGYVRLIVAPDLD